MFDFDTIIDRRRQGSLKWLPYDGSETIASTVADMDFAVAPVILDAIRERLAHPVLGYDRPGEAFYRACQGYLERWHGWTVEREAIVVVPGLVPALNWCCAMLGQPGDGILVPTPVYMPFLSAPGNQGRRCLRVPHLLDSSDTWRMDLAGLDAACDERTRMVMISHPQNPLGRDFTRDELRELADLCQRHDLVLVSDEIHCHLRLDASRPFVSPATLDDDMRRRTVTMLAASKTFNVPGLACAWLVIEDEDLRRRFRRAAAGVIPEISALALAATTAAYDHGEPWRRALVAYLAANARRVGEVVGHLPGARTWPVEATYLSWIDVGAYGWADPKAHCESHGLGLHDGRMFAGPGCLRLNFGCPRTVLDEQLRRFCAACGVSTIDR